MLRRCGISAHFFLVGRQAARAEHESIIRYMKAAGHQVGSHTYRHRGLGHAGRAFAVGEIDQGHKAVEKALGASTPFFRLPYGSGWFRRSIDEILAERKMVQLFWSLRSRDTQFRSARDVIKTVKKSVKKRGGGILVLHERNLHTVRALPEILNWLGEQDFTFVTLDPGASPLAGFPSVFSRGFDHPGFAKFGGVLVHTYGKLTPTIR